MEHLRNLPSVSELMSDPDIQALAGTYGREAWVGKIRSSLQVIRREMIAHGREWEGTEIRQKVLHDLAALARSGFRKVINGTGILIHTNLGRAPLSQSAVQKIQEIAGNYSTVEYQLKKGKRGERNDILEELICLLTGAESALVVNNNAGAVLLALNSLAEKKNVVVSRGELVEIGNSFRIPDIMAKSGAHLKEVGTTNKTKLSDYEKNIDQETALVLKVHTSNYKIVGFTEAAPLKSLVESVHRLKKPLLFDAGSGWLLKKWMDEPSIGEVVKLGVDITTFSGDKLLGGPQAGFIVGKKKWVNTLKRNPLYRALRPDKILLAAIEQTLRLYVEKRTDEIPLFQFLNTPLKKLEKRASDLKSALVLANPAIGKKIGIDRDDSRIGGGALPDVTIPSVALSFKLSQGDLMTLEKSLRDPTDTHQLPIMGRIQKNRYLINLRAIFESELPALEEILCREVKTSSYT